MRRVAVGPQCMANAAARLSRSSSVSLIGIWRMTRSDLASSGTPVLSSAISPAHSRFYKYLQVARPVISISTPMLLWFYERPDGTLRSHLQNLGAISIHPVDCKDVSCTLLHPYRRL
jgi:hypothetical protein